MRFGVIFAVCAAFLLSVEAARAATPLTRASQAMAQNDPAAAIALLEGYQPATGEEQAQRLWTLGVAYNRTGQFRAAIPPLDRLVALYPANTVFRLELAFALIGADQSARALYHLEQAKGAGLSPPVLARVQGEIDKLSQPKFWQGYFRFAIIPESNAARRTAAEFVNFSGLTFTLLPAARQQAATGVDIGFGLSALPRISDNLRAQFSLDASGRLFDGKAPDDVNLRLGAALVSFGDFNTRISGGVFGTRRWLDRQAYSESNGVTLTFGRAFGQRTYLSARAEYEQIDYVQANYSVQRRAMDVTLRYAATPQMVLRVGARAEQRNSAFVQAAGTLVGASVGGDYTFKGGLRLGLDVAFEHNRFDGLHTLFAIPREDRKWTANLRVTHQNWSYKGFAPVLTIGVEKQNSSIVLNTFENVGASIGFTRSF